MGGRERTRARPAPRTWLVARGEVVLDVPSTRRVSELYAGSRRKPTSSMPPRQRAWRTPRRRHRRDRRGSHDVFALLEERRANVARNEFGSPTSCTLCCRDLTPAVLRSALTAKSRRRCCDRSVPNHRRNAPAKSSPSTLFVCSAPSTRAWPTSRHVMTVALDEHGTPLRQIDGIGAVTAVRLIGRTHCSPSYPRRSESRRVLRIRDGEAGFRATPRSP